MQQEVYADLYFLINTSMNLLCLMITAALMHRTIRRWRALLAAAFGGLYALWALLFAPGGILDPLCDCATAVIMCAITFWHTRASVIRLLKSVAVYCFVSMLLGGIMTASYSLINRLSLPLDALQGDGLSVWTFALLSAVASIATLCGGRFFGISGKIKSVTVNATLFGKPITLNAMVDTGNLLRDPVSGRAVIVADRTKLRNLLPPHLTKALEKQDYTAWLTDYEHAKGVRLIPTRTATGETMLVALVPERLYITEGKHTYPADYLIAPADLKESSQGFDAVIPST